jgi:beta-lactamase class A
LIERLGGREQLNQRFRWWGLTQTVLSAPLPDIEGKNRTSPQDLAIALSYIDRGIGISPWNRDRALDFMRRVVNRNFFVKGLAKVEPTARIAHKTGTIGLGRYSVSSRRRVPNPPQRITTFIRCLLAGDIGT